jgi:hypothetical protein
MTVRALIFGAVLSVTDTVVAAFRYRPRIVARHVLSDVELPPCFYVRIDDQVFVVRLKD